MVVERDAVALAKARDSGPQPRHRARDLVAEDPGGGKQAPLDLLDVRAADAAGIHPDEHLAARHLGHRNILDLQDARSPVHGGAHGHEGRS